MIEAKHGGFRLGQGQAFDAREQQGPPGRGRKLAQDHELADVVEQSAHEGPVRRGAGAGLGQGGRVHAARGGMMPPLRAKLQGSW